MPDVLAEQRALIEEALARIGLTYDSPEAQALMAQLQQQAAGTLAPFTPAVRSGLLGRSAAGAAGQLRGEEELIRRAMANAGTTGSGIETSALLAARQRAGGAVRAGRREIETRSDLENFYAGERARGGVAALLAARQGAQQARSGAEIGYRGQLYAGGDAANVAAVTTPDQPGAAGGQPAAVVAQPALGQPVPARPVRYGMSNTTSLQPRLTPGLPLGSQSYAEEQQRYGQAGQSYEQQLRQRELDRAELSRRQADWDLQYGGR